MSSTQGRHPLPAPPGGQAGAPIPSAYSQQDIERPGKTRQRSKSSFSFSSHKSQKSNEGKLPKIDLHETHDEKGAKRLTSKADPTLAMNEAEPSAVAIGTRVSLAPLRAIQHRDSTGQPIAEPDRSNPTRSRWERPLDTIRSFEAAIDGNYKRSSMSRTESSPALHTYGNQANRRSSYYGASQRGSHTPRNPLDSYYGGRPHTSGHRPESYIDHNQDGRGTPGLGNGYANNQQRNRYPRTASEPMLMNMARAPNQTGYEQYGAGQSYETVTTASGSGSYAEPVGYQTDPSSENSSVDRMHATSGGIPADDFGFGGQGQPQQYLEMRRFGHGQQGMQNGGMPSIHENRTSQMPPRAPIKLGTPVGNGKAPEISSGVFTPPVPTKDKRKSWLSRTFSKGSRA